MGGGQVVLDWSPPSAQLWRHVATTFSWQMYWKGMRKIAFFDAKWKLPLEIENWRHEKRSRAQHICKRCWKLIFIRAPKYECHLLYWMRAGELKRPDFLNLLGDYSRTLTWASENSFWRRSPDSWADKGRTIPARDPKQCVVKIRKGRWTGPQIISVCKLAGQERP